MSSDVLLVYKKTHEAVHDESLKSITEVLQNFISNGEIRLDIKAREKVSRGDFIGRDLVIIHGGDGTLTSISHNIDSATPVMGVNSHPRVDDPEGSLGFFMDSDVGTFAADFETALMGKAINNRLPRLQATITSTSGNKIVSDPALNDLLVANTHQYAPSKYRLQRGDFDIKQHSSGLLFSTFIGQGAWFANIVEKHGLEVSKDEIDSLIFSLSGGPIEIFTRSAIEMKNVTSQIEDKDDYGMNLVTLEGGEENADETKVDLFRRQFL